MCGRFVCKSDLRDFAKLVNASIGQCDYKPSFNISPRKPVAVVMEEGEKKLVTMRWGLIPSWAKDESISDKLINARSETIAEKPSFRAAFRERRCLICADGFYEWQETSKGKAPVFIYLTSGKPFFMAGLYEIWKSPSGEEVRSCTIITTAANEMMNPIHTRMPVIVDPEYYEKWLDPSFRDIEVLQSILKPYDPAQMTSHKVTTLVNSPKHNSQDLIAPI